MRKIICLLASLTSLAGLVFAQRAQGAWELRVCASPHDYPASSRQLQGYENRVAGILAEELSARLSFVWTPYNDLRTNVEQYLRSGRCDLVMGVADGAAGMLSTVAYYKAPYVFAYRSDSSLDISSLQDEVLAELTIGTYPNSSVQRALLVQGLEANLVTYAPRIQAGGPDYAGPIMRDVLARDLDVAILYGPDVSPFIKRRPGELTLAPVSPEIAPPMFQMFHIATIGVRPDDEALRDRLNQVISRRWDDIQQVFRAYAVPLQPLPQPRATTEAPETIRIGVVLPAPSAVPALTDATSGAARSGALLAEDLLTLKYGRAGPEFDVLLASSPTVAAAYRAGKRLIETEGVRVLVGGVGEGQAAALSRLAAERGVLFFNIGSAAQAARRTCNATTFHIEASAGMYLDALVSWFSSQGMRRWHIVYSPSAKGAALYGAAVRAIAEVAPHNEIVGTSEVEAGALMFYDSVEDVSQSSPGIVLSLLEPVDHEFFLSQFQAADPQLPVAFFAYPETQTRDFARRLAQVAPEMSATPRVALWDTQLRRAGAGALNERYASSLGAPMESAAWAANAAIQIFASAVVASGSPQPERLAAYLESGAATFRVGKGAEVWFRPADHQLLQPLYLVSTDPSAVWSPDLSARREMVNVIGEFPELLARGASSPLELSLWGRADGASCP